MSALPPHAPAAPPPAGGHRFAMLDGWRATSILLVLAGHLLPIGPKRFDLNNAVAGTGMVIFFTLSGFLITRFLADGAELRSFLIRRFFRIIPLAWLTMAILLVVSGAGPADWAANLLFYANLPPQHLLPGGAHLWSLCVEMQFYVGIAAFVAIAGRRALIGLPILCLAVTALRVAYGRPMDIVTWFRVDEILAGGILALVYGGWYGTAPQRVLARLNPYVLAPLVLLSAWHQAGALAYARPYLTACMVGSTLYAAPPLLTRLFEARVTAYVATVSYAVYIVHGALMDTWLASGDRLVKYAKRPLLIGLTFALAHLSTFRFERPCIEFARRATRGRSVRLPG